MKPGDTLKLKDVKFVREMVSCNDHIIVERDDSSHIFLNKNQVAEVISAPHEWKIGDKFKKYPDATNIYEIGALKDDVMLVWTYYKGYVDGGQYTGRSELERAILVES